MIYLDNAASTPVDGDAALIALDIMREDYGNPSSLHVMGFAAKKRLDRARAQVSALLDCGPDELVFTSGGTEANNLALLGGAETLKRRGNHIVAVDFEHSSVLAPVTELERQGYAVSRLGVERDGLPDLDKIAVAVTDKTILVTCMMVNSETGAFVDIAKLSTLIRRVNPLCLIHCDGVQAFGKLPFSVKKLGVDLFSVSSHKIHGPKGCGALYKSMHGPAKRIRPRVFGGPQEADCRPGTEAMPSICAFGRAAENARLGMTESIAHVNSICNYFEEKAAKIPGVCINKPVSATPYIRSISMPGYKSAHLVNYMSGQGICVSGGSACSGGGRSHVLMSMGLDDALIDSALRVSFSKHTTFAEIDSFFCALVRAGETLTKSR